MARPIRTPDGHGRLGLRSSTRRRYIKATTKGDNRTAPADTPGIQGITFAVDSVVAGLRVRGAELVVEQERCKDGYRLCQVRGPEGIKIQLVEQIR